MIDNDSTIGFVVNEASLYEDDELVEISQSLKESGYDLFISPVSEKSIYYQQLMKLLKMTSKQKASKNLIIFKHIVKALLKEI